MAGESREPEEKSVLRRYGPLAAAVLVAQATLAWIVIEFVFNERGNDELEDLTPEYAIEAGEKKAEVKSRLPFYYTSTGLKRIVVNPAGATCVGA